MSKTAGNYQGTTVATKPMARRRPSSQRINRLTKWLAAHPVAEVSQEEVQAHFRCMPARYWDLVKEEDLAWHLKTLHGFFRKLIGPNSMGSPIAVDSINSTDENLSRVVICSWDRRGLLEQIVAAFSALRVNILRADVYTRTDDLVLDVFEVCESEEASTRDGNRLKELSFLVEGAFSNPPRFASVWATQFHKALPKEGQPKAKLSFDNRKSPEHTILRVEASDRPGLLYDLLHAMTNNGLEIAQAVIDTAKGVAKDQFHLSDSNGEKITNGAQLRQLRKAISKAIMC